MDTSAVFALLDPNDPRHQAASGWFAARRGKQETLVTHSYALVEASAVIQRRLGRGALRALHQEIAPIMTIIEVDASARDAAVGALLAALPTKTSLVDYISFEVMRDRGIRRAFAFDPDFVSAGFETVP